MDVYGWTIEENGQPGKGTKFTINIPELNPEEKENFKLKTITNYKVTLQAVPQATEEKPPENRNK